MNRRTLLRTGVTGTAIAAVCCFTPALVVLFGALGLSALLGWADYVLLPLLGLSLAVTVFALMKRDARD